MGAQDLLEAVSRIKHVTVQQDEALNSVAKALLESDLIGNDRIGKAEQSLR